jgi:hypothetical protein
VTIERPGYRLTVSPDGLVAELASPEGAPWLRLRPLAAVDAVDAPDETVEVEPPREVDGAIEIRRRSTRWHEAAVRLVPADDSLAVETRVRGRGRLARVRLLAVRSLLPGTAHGVLPSGTSLHSLFSPNADDPARAVRPAGERAFLGVVGDAEPGRGRWFFTPPPLYVAFGAGDDRWLGLSLVAPVEELRFPELEVEAGDRSFALALDYEGHTEVDGELQLPTVVFSPHAGDPYAGVALHRRLLVERGVSPEPDERERPAWWSEPIFCGWGAQCADVAGTETRAADLATQERYDAYLATLEREGVVPGTIVIDDKWQATYGRNEPDRAKWPDLRRWIAERHARSQHVLLWWKAWDPEGLPPELCVRNPDGAPLAVDPSNAAAREELRAIMTSLLSPAGLDADGLKIDFTARTPSGGAASASGTWGIALLHELLALVHAAAKAAKPEALVITHTPHPSFVDVTDMIRLNDMLRLGDGGAPASVLPQMEHRARVVHAACPELLVDTDDWCVPSLAAWREYLDAKTLFGVPALYYASKLDASGERLRPDDYEALRAVWSRWRSRR